MSAAISHALGLSRNQRERLLSITMGTGLALVSIFLGLTLAAVATLFQASVAVYIALPLAPLLALAVLAAPIVAPLGVFATFPVGSTGAPVGAATLQSAEAAVVLVALMLIVRRLAMGQTPLAWSPVLFWPLGLMAWMLISMFSALDETLAIKQLVSIAGGVTFAVRDPGVVPRDAGSARAARGLRPVDDDPRRHRAVEPFRLPGVVLLGLGCA